MKFKLRLPTCVLCISLFLTLLLIPNTTQAQAPPPGDIQWTPGTEEETFIPTWWYVPGHVTRSRDQNVEQPTWWYDGPETQIQQDFTTLDISIDVPSGQAFNAGSIPVHVNITADGVTPEIIVQVTSEEVPDKAMYAGYEKTPSGTIQNLAGFQQAKFMGGVSPNGIADITFKYEPLTAGWLNFTIQVWVGNNLLRGPETHAVYVSPVTPTFTTYDVSVTPAGQRNLNAGAIPLNVHLTTDGSTPPVIIQVTSEDVPNKAIYAGYSKNPEGTIQNLSGFQQAKFMGGVGPDNGADITFNYEALETGWLNFTVQVWMGENLIYGPQNHAVYINPTVPTFTNFNTVVSMGANSQGFNAGYIPLNIQVNADGTTPDIVMQVTSEEIPHNAIYAHYEKQPVGAIQNLGGFQQAKFPGGVGPDYKASVTFMYEPLVEGWINYTIQVVMGGNLVYGPERHFIYIKPSGAASILYPPRIETFALTSQVYTQTTFAVDVEGNPDPDYVMDCGSPTASLDPQTFSCEYAGPGYYLATLTATNQDEETTYTETASVPVLVPITECFLPIITRAP